MSKYEAHKPLLTIVGGDKREHPVEQQVQLFGECWTPVTLGSLFGL